MTQPEQANDRTTCIENFQVGVKPPPDGNLGGEVQRGLQVETHAPWLAAAVERSNPPALILDASNRRVRGVVEQLRQGVNATDYAGRYISSVIRLSVAIHVGR